MPFVTKVVGDNIRVIKDCIANGSDINDSYYDITEDTINPKEYAIGASFLQFLELDFSAQEEFRQYVIRNKDDPEFLASRRKMYENDRENELNSLRALFRRPTSDGVIHENSTDQEVLAELASSVYDFHFYINNSTVESHPYWSFRVVNKYFDSDPWKVIYDYSDFSSLQSKYLEMLQFCCDVDYKPLSDLTPLQRYFIFCESGRNPQKHQERVVSSTFQISPKITDNNENAHLFYTATDFWEDVEFETVPAPITPALIEYVKSIPIEGSLGYSASSPAEYAYLEFSLMIEHGIRVRKCKNCGRYFILKGNYGTLYCDRIPEGKTQNCQAIGATKEYMISVNESEALKMYNKVYKRYYARAKNGKISRSDFEKWSSLAQEKRKQFRQEAILENELIKWLAEEFSYTIQS